MLLDTLKNLYFMKLMKLPFNLGAWNFFPGIGTLSGGLELASGGGVNPPVNPSMHTNNYDFITSVIINNTFELLIFQHHFISNLLKSGPDPDFTQHQKTKSF